MKRFIIKTFLYSLPVILLIVYYAVLVKPYIGGDLGLLGQIVFVDDSIQPPNFHKSPISCEYCNVPEDSCVLIIGDSFSNKEGSVRYSDFLAEWSNLPIYNLQFDWWRGHLFNQFIYLSKVQPLPRIVIIESVERELVSRLVNTQVGLSPQMMIERGVIDTASIAVAKKKSTMAKNNSHLATLFSGTQEFAKKRMGIDNPVKKAALSVPMFSCSGKENKLYFYEDDLRVSSKESVCMAKNELENLFAYADSLGIHLYVLVAADKYDIYQPYIVDNTYSKSFVLDSLAAMCNSPQFINSKDTLSAMACNGVCDIYSCGDTHWSAIGAEAVAKMVAERITAQEEDTTLFSTKPKISAKMSL